MASGTRPCIAVGTRWNGNVSATGGGPIGQG